jgi:predicted Zn-dependent peptidase
MKYTFPMAMALCLAGLPAGAGQPLAPKAAKPAHAGIPMKQLHLKNGLRVILSEDHNAPTFGISVTYNVGSRDEVKGRTGFAHLFEHMMFQGSEKVGKGEHYSLVLNNGGEMNGTTDSDRTDYFETMPSNQLELGLFLESDRMRSLVINQANLDNQRNAVQEERRLGMDNQPYGLVAERLQDLAYDNFAYKHDTIGSMEDLNAASVQDVASFFKTYYAPNNAVLVLVGDFQPKAALALVRKYFEAIPSQAMPPKPDLTEPEQKAERRSTATDPLAPLPRVDVAYKTVPAYSPDWYALRILTNVLGQGESARLYQVLVKEKAMASTVFCYLPDNVGASLFRIGIGLNPGQAPEAVEKVLYEQIAQIAKEGIAPWELEKARMQARHQSAEQRRSTLYRAILVGEYASKFGQADLINHSEASLQAVTAEQVKEAAHTFLTAARRSVLTTLPQAKPEGDAGSAK